MRSTIAIFVVTFGLNTASAIELNCNFLSEMQISISGEWVSSETNFETISEAFGDGLVLDVDNELIAKIDQGTPFKASETEQGALYLMGSDTGIGGKVISTEGENIKIYDGLCFLSFGNN